MKRFKKELSWLLVVALVVSSLVIGLGQLTPKAATDATGTSRFMARIHVKKNDQSCGSNNERGTDSDFEVRFMNASNVTIATISIIDGPEANTTTDWYSTQQYVNKTITKCQLIETRHSDEFCMDWIEYYYEYAPDTWAKVAEDRPGGDSNQFNAVGHERTVATTWFGSNVKTLTFNANGGSPNSTYDAIPYQTISAPGAPSRTGHTFTGWSGVPARMPNGAATYSAGWTVNQYSVSFNGNGGSAPATITQNYGTSVSVPSSSRTGYTFNGWSPACPTTMPANNTTCVAQWTLNTYTITWNANGGTGGTTTSVNHGATPTPPTVSRTGYTFAGWSPAIVAATGATTYTAQWNINSYTITWDANGGTGGTTTSVNHGATPTPPTVSKTGYTFDGWSPAIVAATGATTYTAQWNINSYTITWDANGGTGGTTTSVNHGVTPTPPTVTRTGYTFDGWSPAIVAATGATTYTAQWSQDSYTYTYDANGGTGGTSGSLHYGDPIPAAPTVTRTGYTFTAWSPTPALTMPANDVTYTAGWTINQHTISFNSGGGSAVAAITGNYNTTATAPTAPTKTGNTFAGWYTDAGLTNAVTWPYTITGDVTFYAKWTVNSYSITFDANGGTGGTGPTSMQYGAALSAPVVTQTGYTFAGWDTTVPSTVPAADTTYTAQWTLNYYTVSFSTDGGSAVTPITQNYGTSVTQPTAPTKTGNTFDGWYSDSGLTAAVTWPYTLGASDVTFYAKWTVNSYYITFDANGGTGGIAATLMQYGAALTAPTVTKTGSTFSGWSTTVPATVPAADTIYTAQWGLDSFTISFDSDGGSAVAAITQEFGTSVTAPADPTKTGYTFAGWVPAIPDPMPAQDVECVAQWTLNTYTISWDADGGTGGGSDSVDHGTVPTPIDAGTKTGYTFSGWDPAIVAATEAATYTAQWTINTYTITWDADGGDGGGTDNVDHGTVPTPIDAGTKAGFIFAGWDPAIIAATADATYTAQWTMDAPELIPADGSTTVIDDAENLIYGLEEGMTQQDFENLFVAVLGNGSLEITPTPNGFGTGTKVELINNATEEVVETYYIVIFGDINGDGFIGAIDANIINDYENFAIEWDVETELYLFAAGDLNGDEYAGAIDANIVEDYENFVVWINQTTGLADEY